MTMSDCYRFAAPGRTEIGGNHTDHQHGCVLAAAVGGMVYIDLQILKILLLKKSTLISGQLLRRLWEKALAAC